MQIKYLPFIILIRTISDKADETAPKDDLMLFNLNDRAASRNNFDIYLFWQYFELVDFLKLISN